MGRLRSLLALLLLVASLPATAMPPPTPALPRIVAIGDVHGDLDAFHALLVRVRLIDAGGRWTGGRSVLVQTGDVLDRGPHGREVIDLLARLEGEAEAAGGKVVAVLGNHEVMNLMGDLRYVSPADFASFAAAGSEERRRRGYQDYLAWREERGIAAPPDEAGWMASHPLGWLERMDAFAPGGVHGRWLRAHRAAAQVGDVAFLHGGVSPALAGASVAEVGERVAAEIAAFDRCRAELLDRRLALAWFTLTEVREAAAGAAAAGAGIAACQGLLAPASTWIQARDGPLWYRGFAELGEEEGRALVEGLWAGSGVDFFVVGHSPSEDGRIQARFGRRVFLIDTGMLGGYLPCGSAAALELRDGVFRALAADGDEPLLLAAPARNGRRFAWRSKDGAELPFASEAELCEFLRTAAVIESKEIGQGITRPKKLLLERDGVRMNAVFRDVDEDKPVAVYSSGRVEPYFRDCAAFECAAYALAQDLGIDRVPPVVARRIGGKDGSLQAWVENARTEGDRLKRNDKDPDPERWDRQSQVLRLFDALIANSDRNSGNVLYDPDWALWMIDHTRAFRRWKEPRGLGTVERCPRRLWERLRAIDPQRIRESLKPYLKKAEIDALLERRKKIVADLSARIAAEGEAAVLFDEE